MSDVLVRRVVDDDGVAACEALYREYVAWVLERFHSLHGLDRDGGREEAVHEELRAEYPRLLGDRGRMVLATVDRDPAAVGALKPLSHDVAELKRLYVRPGYRGLGLGRRVLDHLVGEAREIGYRSVRLDTADFMTEAHRLYESAGFVDRAEHDCETTRNGLGACARFMSLDLEGASGAPG